MQQGKNKAKKWAEEKDCNITGGTKISFFAGEGTAFGPICKPLPVGRRPSFLTEQTRYQEAVNEHARI